MVQGNLPLIFCINEILISLQKYEVLQEKASYDFFFTVALQPFMKYHSPPCFPPRNIAKNAKTHTPLVRDVIIEQPHTLDFSSD